jgi:LuxR family transcriptional regulator, maltose regulon positive regulatory protein
MTSRAGRHEPPNFSFSLIQTRALTRLMGSVGDLGKMTLIAAPTGYGKTVLQTALCRHLQSQGVLTHWLGLDERDQTVDAVLTLLERSFFDSSDPLEPSPALHQSDDPPDERIDRLIGELARREEPSVLLIDNISFCDDETLRPLVDALVFQTSAHFSLIIAGTREPPMSMARAKLEGKLTCIGFADLAMGDPEIRALFGPALCKQLGDDALRLVARHTEGWPAAIRLMQIILQSAEHPLETLRAFSGTDEDLADMLNRQVLADFDDSGRQFLLEIAELRSFCVPLCLYATANAEAAEHVARVLRQNLFIIPLDRNRTWYRLHGLFREFLSGEAERSLSRERRQAVLLRAAEWCEQSGHWSDAVDYVLSAEAYGAAATMLERVAPRFVRDRGDLRRYIGWIERLYRAQAEIGWEAEFWYVWALVFHRRYEAARQQVEHLVERVEEAETASGQSGAHQELIRRIEVIRVTIATYTDQLREAQARGRTWLSARAADDPFDVATVACAIGISNCAHYDFAAARETFRDAQSSIAQSDSAYGVAWVTALSTMVWVHEGDYAQAYSVYAAALARARQALGDNAGMTSTLALLTAKCAIEGGNDVEARDALELGMRRAQNHGVADTALCGLDAAIKLWASPLGGSMSLAMLREVAASYVPRISLMLSCLIVQRMLRLGRLDDALLEAAQLGLAQQPARPPPAALTEYPVGRALYLHTAIELDIASGRLRQAEQAIAEESRLAKVEGRWGHLVELALADMSVSLCTQNPAPAARHLTRAISYAAKRGYRRPFRDRAEQIAGLVNETKPQSWGFALDEERAFFSDICRHLPIANSTLIEQLERLDVQATLLETPTARELELLALIEAGLSNQQLADRLSVSVATVKWHLYNLYAKLGVSSRSAALAKGRALGLLSR